MKYIKLIRVKHYLKNLLVFLPLFFNASIFDMDLFIRTGTGFISFCFISSVVYIINDIKDVEYDRLHISKRTRPIANNSIPIKKAILLVIILGLMSITLSITASNSNYYLVLFPLVYLAVFFAYSIKWKHIPILDITILASGFLMRLMYGSAISGIAISGWLYLTVIVVSFYMGIGKRFNELKINEDLAESERIRHVLTFYTINFLDKSKYMFLCLAIVFYSLWTIDPITIERTNSEYLFWSVPLVIIICLLYNLNIETHDDGDPIEVLYKNKPLMILTLLFITMIFGLIYII